MNERIKDKIEHLEKFLQELLEIVPGSFDEYKENFTIKAACERYAEKIIEGVIDLAFLVIKEKKLKIPEDEESSFGVLSQNNIISFELAKKLMDAKGMRNIIVHEYGEIDDEVVFNSVSEELKKDTKEFIKYLRLNLT